MSSGELTGTVEPIAVPAAGLWAPRGSVNLLSEPCSIGWNLAGGGVSLHGALLGEAGHVNRQSRLAVDGDEIAANASQFAVKRRSFAANHGRFTVNRAASMETRDPVTETGSSITETRRPVMETQGTGTETRRPVTETRGRFTAIRRRKSL